MELALTARLVKADEAKTLRLVSEVLPDVDNLKQRACQLATYIAGKSPVAVTGTKHLILEGKLKSTMLLI